jgi:hypothetical protein
MDEDNALKADIENSNSSLTSSTSEATSSNVKNVLPFTFVDVKCEIEVSTVVELRANCAGIIDKATLMFIMCDMEELERGGGTEWS